ncbi:hypothetical protein ABZ815_28405 [Nonomuraea sp. NPDC047529]|uniref:hypothetical protein n=1 Tax=Nonomuraea sp. NPDC047529 TaxID=3155623 RepID=UPI0033C17613
MNEEARTGRSPGPWKAVVTGLGLVLATISAAVGILSFLGDEAERAEARRDRARTSPAVQQPEPAPTVSPTSGPTSGPTSQAPTPAPTPPVHETLPRSFLGVWSGTLTQGGSSYRVRLRLRNGEAGEPVGTVAYEPLHCAGELTLRSASPESLELAETLTSGTGCTPEGNIALDRHANGTLTYNYFHIRGAVTTTGTLKKTGN